MKKLSRFLLACVVLALLIACAAFSASAATDVRTTFVCPCSDCVAARKTNAAYTCPEISTWQSLSTSGKTTFTDGGHYYVNTSKTYGQLVVPEGCEVVLLVDHCTVTYTGTARMISLVGSDNKEANPMTMHIIGNNGGGLQTNKSGSTEGPLCQVGGYDVGHLHLYGDLTLSSDPNSAAASVGGLLRIPSNGRVYIHDNVGMGLTNDKDPYLKGHTTTSNGSVAYLQNGNASLYMEAGTLEGASSGKAGGTIYMTGGSATICGSATVTGCSATYGGAAYISAGTFEVSGNAIITGGAVSNYGGALYSNGTLTINGGTITGAAAAKGGTAIASNGGTITINGGTINGVAAAEDGTVATPSGGTIYLLSSANNLNINGGTINGGSAELGGTIYQNGGTITLGSCDAYPNGATINGGTATDGGTVYMAAGTMNITKGSVYGGSATNGGAIYVASGATATVSGGSVNGSIAEKGGAFYLAEGANFAMTGGTVSGCAIDNTTTTAVLGGAFYLPVASAETMTFTGGTIQGGTIRRAANEQTGITALSGYGGGIYMASGALTMAGTGMTGGYAYQGGAIYMVDGTLTINGSNISNASSASYGGGIHTDGGALYMVSGTISNCTSASYGGSLYLDSTLDMTGGTITEGEGTRGGNIFVNKTFNMSNGTVSGGSGKRGGNMYLAGDFTMTGGTISGGTATEYAGNIFMAGNKTYAFNGGTVENGSATGSSAPGGNLHIYNGDLKIEDTAGAVIIRNGTANKGGNISVSQASSTDKSTATINLTRSDSLISGGTAPTGAGVYVQGKLTLTSGTINGGKATTGGGCVYLVGGSSFTMNGGTLNGGKTTATKAKYGACVYIEGGTFTLTAGTLNGGSVTSGAAVYMSGSAAKMNMSGGYVNNGTVTNQGTLAYIAGGATLNMTGGEMYSSAGGDSGIRIQGSGKAYLHGNALVKAGAGARDAFDLVGTSSTPATLVLAGNARVGDLDGNQTTNHNITLQSYTDTNETTGVSTTHYPRIRVANDWTGYASMTDSFGSTATGDFICTVETGDTIKYYAQCGTWDAETLTFTQGGNFDGRNLIHGSADEGDLPIFGENGILMLPRAKVVADGVTSWYRISDLAVDAASATGGYTVICKDDTAPITLEAGQTAIVDFNGSKLTVTGEGTLYGMDSSALATGTGAAEVTFEGITVKPVAKNPASGEAYIAVVDGNTATFHAVTANITAVSIRPGTVGMYYTAQFVCDDAVKAYLDSFGLAISLSAMPNEDFQNNKTVLYTQSAGSELASGSYNSVIVQNIMAAGNSANKQNGEMPIFANAYLKLTVNGEPITVMATQTSNFSLKTLLQHLNTYWDTFDQSAKDSLATKIYDPYIRNFEGDDWDLYNLRTHANGGYTAEEEAILAERRQTVLDYMRESVSLLWRSDKTMTYGLGNTQRDNGASFTIVEGRLYKGLPYVYGAGTQDAFLEYAGEPDENGIYTITGLEATALNYESYGGRVGNDCSGAVTNAWSQISTTLNGTTSSACHPYYGVVPVGNYNFNAPINPDNHRLLDTKVVVESNGEQVMYEAYAMLKPADAAFHQEYPSTKGNHIRMVVSVNVVRNEDGTINGSKSTITMLEQTRTQINANKTEKHPVTGETIYVIGGVDKTYKFSTLFGEHYIPVTIAELRDPSALEETWVDDTLEEDTIENLFTGSIIANRYLDSVRITIYNENGEIVQQTTGRRSRSAVKDYKMERFLTEKPGSMKGTLNLETIEALEPGNYRCTVTVKLTIDDDYIHTVRDFTFSK